MSHPSCPEARLGYNSWRGLVFFAAIFILSREANAAILEFAFGGEITQVSGVMPAPWADVQIGDLWSLSVTFDTEAEDLFPSAPSLGEYDIISGSLSISGITDESTDGFVDVLPDSFDELSYALTGLTQGTAIIVLLGPDAFATDELPTSLDLEDFPLSFMEYGIPFVGSVRGDVSSFAAAVVPTPNAWLPLCSLAFSLRRRRR